MLTETQAAKLARIQNYRTRYEVIAEMPGRAPMLVCYLSSLSRHGLLEAMRGRSERIIKALGIGPDDTITFAGSTQTRPQAQIGAWTIRLSGRTQRDAIIAGEHPYLPEVSDLA